MVATSLSDGENGACAGICARRGGTPARRKMTEARIERNYRRPGWCGWGALL